MKRRKIPILRINMNRGINYSVLKDIPEIQHIVLNETICAIKDGVEKDKGSISIFEIADSNCFVELSREKWKSTLKNTMEYFVEREDYNKCIEIRELINKL